MSMLKIKALNKHYNELHVLKDISLTINQGEFIAITGPSGSGKSTLLRILGLLDSYSGEYFWQNSCVSKFTDKEAASIRNASMGFVFQNYELIDYYTALENVLVPAFYAGKDLEERAIALLKQVGLENRMSHRPYELSGGEQQRVSIARALINSPKIIFADEPTGNLDTETSEEIMSIFKALNNKGTTIVMVTHNKQIEDKTGRSIHLIDGKVL